MSSPQILCRLESPPSFPPALLFALPPALKVHAGHVLIIRYEGPKGSPGMPEQLSPGAALVGAGLGKYVGLHAVSSPFPPSLPPSPPPSLLVFPTPSICLARNSILFFPPKPNNEHAFPFSQHALERKAKYHGPSQVPSFPLTSPPYPSPETFTFPCPPLFLPHTAGMSHW